MFTDSHTHIYSEEFGLEQQEAVRRAIQAGITRLYLPNIDPSSADAMLKLVLAFPENCFPMMGLHPTSVGKDYIRLLEITRDLAFSRPFAAIGEIGMDLYWDKTYVREQEEAFRTQIGWAKELGLPLVIHSREAFREIFAILDSEKDKNLSGVFHSFTGTEEEAKKALSYGFYIGINGIVTFRNSHLPDILKIVPPDRLLLETDSPYLAPVPFRGRRNESAYLLHIADKIADVYGMPVEELARITTTNALTLFKLS